MILFEKIIVNTQIVTLFPHYGKLPHFSLNYHILCFQKNVQKFLFPKKNYQTVYHRAANHRAANHRAANHGFT